MFRCPYSAQDLCSTDLLSHEGLISGEDSFQLSKFLYLFLKLLSWVYFFAHAQHYENSDWDPKYSCECLESQRYTGCGRQQVIWLRSHAVCSLMAVSECTSDVSHPFRYPYVPVISLNIFHCNCTTENERKPQIQYTDNVNGLVT